LIFLHILKATLWTFSVKPRSSALMKLFTFSSTWSFNS
jgi:hypothetical protein